MLSTHIDNFVNNHMKNKWYSKNTVKNYTLALARFVSFCQDIPIEHINIVMIDSFTQYLGQKYGLSSESKNLHLSAIRSLLTFLRKRDVICINPATIDIVRTRNKEMFVCSAEQVQMMVNVCNNTRDKSLIHVLFSTLIRVSECSGIKHKDISMYDRKIMIIGKWWRKRVAFLSEQAYNHLDWYTALRTDKSEYLFVSESNNSSGQQLSRNSIEDIIRKAAVNAGIPGKVTPHTLRRSWAVFLLKNWIDIRAVQLMMWHASIETTMQYLQLDDQYLQKQHKAVYDSLSHVW